MAKLYDELIATLRAAIQPVAADDAMPEAGRKIFLANYLEMLEHMQQLDSAESMHHIHQMRVATRRIRSALRVLLPYYDAKLMKPFARALRATAQALGAVRDLDVMMDNIKAHQATLPAEGQASLNGLLDRLSTQRGAAYTDLQRWLKSRDYQMFTRKFANFLLKPGKGSLKPPSTLTPFQVRHVTPVIFHQHLAQVRAFAVVLPSDDAELLHALRIEFKRLRYVLTFFQDVMGASIGDYLEQVKRMQDHLGRLNDAIVAQHQLSAADKSEAEALAAYHTRLVEEARQLTQDFPAVWTRFNTRSTQRKLSEALLTLH